MKIIVLVKEESADIFSQIIELAEQAGMIVTRQMPRFAMFSGEINEDNVHHLKQVAGVESIEINREIQASYESHGQN